MIIIGIHPILSVHFCGGELHSFALLSDSAEKSCCASMADMAEEAHTHSITDLHHNCCDTQTLQIATDDYQSQQQQITLNKPLLSFDKVWFALASVFELVESDDYTLVKNAFPPGGLYLQHVDILTYICIYRI